MNRITNLNELFVCELTLVWIRQRF